MNYATLKHVSRTIHSALPKELEWKYDNRFNILLAEFNIKFVDQIFHHLKPYFFNIWDSTGFTSAPGVAHTACARFGAVLPGQLILCTNLNDECFIYVIVWPWSDGETISMRMAPFNQRFTEKQTLNLAIVFNSWFLS